MASDKALCALVPLNFSVKLWQINTVISQSGIVLCVLSDTISFIKLVIYFIGVLRPIQSVAR